MKKALGETSFSMFLLKKIVRGSVSLKLRLAGFYQDSVISDIANYFKKNIIACLGDSFLGRTTRITGAGSIAVLNESKVIGSIVKLCQKSRNRMIHYSKTSVVFNAIEESGKEMRLFSIKNISIVMIVAIAVNIILCGLLKKGIDIFSWVISLLFLFLGFSSLFNKASEQDIVRTSRIFDFLSRIRRER